MKKQLLCSAMCILLMLSAYKTTAQVVASGTTGDCTWELTGTALDLTLTISGAGAMEDYDPSYDYWAPWYLSGNNIKTLVIEQGVTTIGNYVFYFCTGLTSVTIPHSVTTIGRSAFYECSGLTSLTIGNSVTTIGNWAFADCYSLTSLTIPGSVTTIGNNAFSGCSALTVIYVKALTPPVLGDNVFYDVSTDIPVYVCGSVNAYNAAPGWGTYFTNILPDVTCSSGIEAISLQDITLYPNPATEQVTVTLPAHLSSTLFTLCDLQGRALLHQTVANGEAISVSHLSSGIYIAKLGNRTAKLVKR